MIKFLCAVLFLLISTTSHADITSGLVGYWNLNDGSGISALDGSGRGYTGTLVNTPTWTLGKRGKALSFNGTNQAVSIGNVDLTTTNVITIAMWLKVDSFANDDDLAIEISTDISSSDFAAYIDPNSFGGGICVGELAVALRGSTSFNIACYTRPSAGVWHHYVAIYDKGLAGNEVYLYIDGTLQTPTGRPINADNTNNFGNEPIYLMSRAASTLFLAGQLDDVRIYTRALSAGDVTELYNLGNSTANGLVGWWKMDEGTGTLTEDSSGNGNHGTLTNGPTWTAGVKSGAVNFDGSNDYVSLGNISALINASQVTISAWVNPSLTQAQYGRIFDSYYNGIGTGISMNAIAGANGGEVDFNVMDAGTGTQFNYSASSALIPNTWQHIVMVFDGSQTGSLNRLKGYLNGQQLSLTNHIGSIPATTASSGVNPAIGAVNATGGDVFNGLIDDVRIYNRALTASEVAGLYNASTRPTMGGGALGGGRIN